MCHECSVMNPGVWSIKMIYLCTLQLIANRGHECEEATAPATKLRANPQEEDGGLGSMLEATMFPYGTVNKAIKKIRE